MRIQPVASPHAILQPQTTNNSDARARAIAKLESTAQAQAHPVQNPTQIAPEEVLAIPQAGEPEQPEARQPDTLTEPEQPETPKKTEDPLSKQFAQLARQEKALRQRQQQADRELKAREEALKAREEALKSQPSFDQSKYVDRSRLSTETLQVLAEMGISYDQLTEQILNVPAANPQVQAQMSRLEQLVKDQAAKIDQFEKNSQQAQTDQYQAAIKQITNDVKHLVSNDPEFEVIKATRAHKDVVELIERTFQEEGRIMAVEEAAREVAAYIEDEITNVAKISRIQKRLNVNASKAQTEAKVQTPSPTPAQPQPQMKTLTNATASTRKLTARERAIAAMEGRLK